MNKKNNTDQSVRVITHTSNNNSEQNRQEALIASYDLVEVINQKRTTTIKLTHANFLKKVPKVLKGNEVKFYSVYLDQKNEERPCYRFPEREAHLMVMSESYEVQAAVYDVMKEMKQQLEQPTTLAIPQSKKEWIMLALEQENKIEELEKLASNQSNQLTLAEKTIEIQKPKAEYYDQVNSSEGLITIKQTAEIFKMGQNTLFEWLRGAGYLFSKGDNYNVPKAEYVKEREYFELKEAYYTKEHKDFFGKAKSVKVFYSKVYVTKKGFNHLFKKLKGDESNELF